MTKSTDHREDRAATAEAMSDAAETITRETRRVADATGEEATAYVAAQKLRVQDYLKDFSSALTEGGQSLADGGHDTSAHMVKNLATELHDAARTIEGRSPTELLQELEQFARRRPALFFGAALLAGFGVARFAKSAERPPAAGSASQRRR